MIGRYTRPQLGRKPFGGNEHEVSFVRGFNRQRLGMADDPEHVSLTTRACNGRESVQYEMHVARSAGVGLGLVGSLQSYVVPRALQRARQVAAEVPITPPWGHLG